MAEDAIEEGEVRLRRRRVNKRSSRKRKKLIQNLRWILGAFAIGLPFLVLLVYLASLLLWYLMI